MLVNLLDCCVSNLMPMPFDCCPKGICNHRLQSSVRYIETCCSDHIRNLKVTVPKERWVLGWVGWCGCGCGCGCVCACACVCVCVCERQILAWYCISTPRIQSEARKNESCLQVCYVYVHCLLLWKASRGHARHSIPPSLQ